MLFGAKAVIKADNNINKEPNNPNSTVFYILLLKETVKRDRPKALYYKDILIIVVRHLVTRQATLAIALKFIYYKRCNNKPKPYISAYRLAAITDANIF